jgi:hypothetical protein
MKENNPKEKGEVAIFIEQAIEKGLPVETMEKLFALREKVKAEQAREAYVDALSLFQSQCPVIKKTKKVLNKDQRTVRYTYAPLDAIAEQIKKPLAQNGLSYSWEVQNQPGLIKATAKVTHRLGHSETSSFEVPIDKEGYMTEPQKYASALTFAKRYSLCDILGISTSDEDTDAVDVGKEKGAKSPKAKIVFLLRALESDTGTKEKVEEAVKSFTQLNLEEENYEEIVSRLEVLVRQKNEDSKVRQ